MLALRRAAILPELFLETEPEWRLYEALRASRILFEVRAASLSQLNREDPRGHARFCLLTDRWHTEIRYAHANAFKINSLVGERTFATVAEVIKYLKNR